MAASKSWRKGRPEIRVRKRYVRERGKHGNLTLPQAGYLRKKDYSMKEKETSQKLEQP